MIWEGFDPAFRQQAIQRDMQHMMNDMLSMVYYPTPVFVPIVIAPDKHGMRNEAPTSKQSAAAAQTSSQNNKNSIRAC